MRQEIITTVRRIREDREHGARQLALEALRALVAHLDISLEEVVGVGDGYNDIPLLTLAGMAIAMGNAPDGVKAIADYVTLDVDQNGLAAALEKVL